MKFIFIIISVFSFQSFAETISKAQFISAFNSANQIVGNCSISLKSQNDSIELTIKDAKTNEVLETISVKDKMFDLDGTILQAGDPNSIFYGSGGAGGYIGELYIRLDKENGKINGLRNFPIGKYTRIECVPADGFQVFDISTLNTKKIK